uniref:Cytokine receptor like factor 3 n=1 Tax=Sus scrofa TaxID=9823 RepID=A0A4X1TK93_PIG
MDLEPELLLQEARENVEAAQSYRRELGHRLQGLQEARRQIKESASQTRDVLKQHFNDLKGTLGKLLDERLVTLLQEVDAIEQETIKPLDDCQKLIEHGVNTAEDLVQEGEIAILGGVGEQNEKLWNFTKKASHIQLDRWTTTLQPKITGSSSGNVLPVTLRMCTWARKLSSSCCT